MKEKTTIPKRVKGTVLFTVVSVMMVLIVFLTATLALAVTANKRAYTVYQQEQAEYTAKAILEAVNKNIADDTDGTNIRTDIVGLAAGASMDVDVQIDDGTATETHTVNIRNTGETRSIYENNAWKDVNVYAVSVTVGSNTTAASATYESFLGMDVIPGTTTTTTTITPGGGDGGAFVSLGDTAGTEIATKGYTTGGTYIGIGIAPQEYTMSSSGKNVIDAPYYINGGLTLPSWFSIHFTKPDDFMVVMGDMTTTNNDSIQTSFAGYDDTGANYENTPYIYVDGKFTVTVGSVIGDPNHAVNLYCGSVSFAGNGTPKVYGDIYLMDEGVDSVFGNSGTDTHLYKWVKGTITRGEGNNTEYGNVYSMGNVRYEGKEQEVEGDIHVKGNMVVSSSNLTVKGNIIVEGTLTVTGTLNCTGGSIYAGTIENTGTINCTAGTVNAVNHTDAAINDISPAPAVVVKDSKNYYDLKAFNGGRDVYPSNYTKAYLDSNKLDHPAPADYVGTYGYPDSITSLSTTLFDAGEYQCSVYCPGGHTTSGMRYPVAGGVTDAVYYTAPGSDIGMPNATYTLQSWAGTVECVLTYRKHTIIGGVETTSDTWYKSISLSSSGAAAYPDYASYFAANNAEFNEVFTHAGAPATPIKNIELLKNTDGKGQNYYKVTTDCVINGYFDKKNLYLDGSGGAITVVMDDVSFGNKAGIIVNDANQVTIFVVGTVSVGQASGIVTTDYLDMLCGTGNWDLGDVEFGEKALNNMTSDVTIEQVQTVGNPKYPNVLIYSDSSSTLQVQNHALVTAMVRAPALVYDGDEASTASKTANYELPTGNTVKYGSGPDISPDNERIGLIGQLIAGRIKLNSNGNWGMLYITDPTSSGIHPGHSGIGVTTTTTTTAGTSSYQNLYTTVY